MLDTSPHLKSSDPLSLQADDLDAVGYVSASTHTLGLLGLTYLFLQCYWNNRRRGLTGRLYYDGSHFGILLEGNTVDIERVSRVIERDGRHRIVDKCFEPDIPMRHYAHWQMLFDGADMVASVLPDYRDAVDDIGDGRANDILQLMTLYRA